MYAKFSIHLLKKTSMTESVPKGEKTESYENKTHFIDIKMGILIDRKTD